MCVLRQTGLISKKMVICFFEDCQSVKKTHDSQNWVKRNSKLLCQSPQLTELICLNVKYSIHLTKCSPIFDKTERMLLAINNTFWLNFRQVSEEEKPAKMSKGVERRESTRLQSAAKLLRSLSKSKDIGKSPSSSKTTPTVPTVDEKDEPKLDRSQSMSAGSSRVSSRRRKNKSEKGGSAEEKGGRIKPSPRAQSFHGKADRQSSKMRKEIEENKRNSLLVLSCSEVEARAASKSCEDILDSSPYPKGYATFSGFRGRDGVRPNCSEILRHEGPVYKSPNILNGARSSHFLDENLTLPRNFSVEMPHRCPDLIQDLPR